MEGVKCYCNLVAEVKTSHTPNNFNRNFYRCPKSPETEKCWANKLQPTQYMGTPSPATSQAPASSTTPLRPMKRSASAMEEPSDFPQASPSQKRTRLIDAALRAGGALSVSSLDVFNAIAGGTARNIDAPQASPSARYNDVDARLNADNVAFSQTPTRSARRLAVYSPSPSPGPFDFELGSQQSSASTAQGDKMAHPLGSGEVTPELIENMVNVLGNIPEYIRKLDRKRIAAEKSRDARNKKIEYLENEVKRLKDRQKELELIVAGYESKGF